MRLKKTVLALATLGICVGLQTQATGSGKLLAWVQNIESQCELLATRITILDRASLEITEATHVLSSRVRRAHTDEAMILGQQVAWMLSYARTTLSVASMELGTLADLENAVQDLQQALPPGYDRLHTRCDRAVDDIHGMQSQCDEVCGCMARCIRILEGLLDSLKWNNPA